MKWSRLYILFLLASIVACSSIDDTKEIKIAVTSSLYEAVKDVGKQYAKDSVTLEINTDASWKLMTEINNGRPTDVFFTADSSYASMLKKKYPKLIKHYVGKSELVAIARKGTKFKGVEFYEIGLANPRVAPFGRLAHQYLKSRWEKDGKLPPKRSAQNVNQVNQYVSTGAIEVGLTARSSFDKEFDVVINTGLYNEFYLIDLNPSQKTQRFVQAFVSTEVKNYLTKFNIAQ